MSQADGTGTDARHIAQSFEAAEAMLRNDLGLPPAADPAQWPARLNHYESLSPGAAGRLLNLTETEQKRRFAHDQTVIAARWLTLRTHRALTLRRHTRDRLQMSLATVIGYAVATASLIFIAL